MMGPGGQGAAIAVDTTATVERKVAALMGHKSQMADPDAVAQRVQDWGRANGELAGLGEGRSAELFRTVQIPSSTMGTGDPWPLVQHVAFEGPVPLPRRSPPPAPTCPSSG